MIDIPEVLVIVPYEIADLIYDALVSKPVEPYLGCLTIDGFRKVAFPLPSGMTLDNGRALMASVSPEGTKIEVFAF